MFEEIKSTLNTRNALYYSVQNLLTSRFLPKYINVKNIRNYHYSCYFIWV